jgi:hypothetical protein
MDSFRSPSFANRRQFFYFDFGTSIAPSKDSRKYETKLWRCPRSTKLWVAQDSSSATNGRSGSPRAHINGDRLFDEDPR